MSSFILIFLINCYIKSETVNKQYFSGLQPSLTRITRYVLCVRVISSWLCFDSTKFPIGTIFVGDIYEIKSIYNYFIIQYYPQGLLFGRCPKPFTPFPKRTTHRSGNKKSRCQLCFLIQFFKFCFYHFVASIKIISVPQNGIGQSIP